MNINVKKNFITETPSDVLVLYLFEDKELDTNVKAIDEKLDNVISGHILANGFKSKLSETYAFSTFGKLPVKNILLVGLGKAEEFSLEKLRIAASKFIRKITSDLKPKTVATAFETLACVDSNLAITAQTLTEGLILGSYKFDKYKSKKDENGKIEEFSLILNQETNEADVQNGINLGTTVAEAVNFARNLVNEPAAEITPSKLAEVASGIEGVTCRIIEKDECEKLGMGSYLAVSKGSDQPPKFIHLTYKPEGTPTKKLAIIGKGVTFDSGGLDIKPAASMVTMKDDMGGAAAILATVRAITALKPSVEVHGIIAATENMPNGSAYKPGDVLVAMNGKTIEVDNTDAEGRLTLADALCYAEKLEVDEIIDLATLTGACVVALGYHASALLGNNQDLIDRLLETSKSVGERLWQLPMFEEYFEDLKSDVADFKNSGGRFGGTSSAALFLKEFVEKTPWAHIDIAGPAFISKDIRENLKGGTGVGVRTLIKYIVS